MYEAFIAENGLTHFNSLSFTASSIIILVLAINKLIRTGQNELVIDVSKYRLISYSKESNLV
jgi:hypothetical protein